MVDFRMRQGIRMYDTVEPDLPDSPPPEGESDELTAEQLIPLEKVPEEVREKVKKAREEGTAVTYINRKGREWSTDDEGFRSREVEFDLYSGLGVIRNCKCTALKSSYPDR